MLEKIWSANINLIENFLIIFNNKHQEKIKNLMKEIKETHLGYQQGILEKNKIYEEQVINISEQSLKINRIQSKVEYLESSKNRLLDDLEKSKYIAQESANCLEEVSITFDKLKKEDKLFPEIREVLLQISNLVNFINGQEITLFSLSDIKSLPFGNHY